MADGEGTAADSRAPRASRVGGGNSTNRAVAATLPGLIPGAASGVRVVSSHPNGRHSL